MGSVAWAQQSVTLLASRRLSTTCVMYVISNRYGARTNVGRRTGLMARDLLVGHGLIPSGKARGEGLREAAGRAGGVARRLVGRVTPMPRAAEHASSSPLRPNASSRRGRALLLPRVSGRCPSLGEAVAIDLTPRYFWGHDAQSWAAHYAAKSVDAGLVVCTGT